jgi:hypothetical protein
LWNDLRSVDAATIDKLRPLLQGRN